MTITRDQVADLRPGDVVEFVGEAWLPGTVLRGPLFEEGGYLYIAGSIWIRDKAGRPSNSIKSLTVISRAPRPLYVNSDREKPVPGDVVVSADGGRLMWVCRDPWVSSNPWCRVTDLIHQPRTELPERLRLLVDGETGQVVP